ncbi:SH3 domain-containing protein, partial [Streptomyces sp. NPDC057927]
SKPTTTASTANRKTTSAVNLRSTASYGDNIISTIPKGAKVQYVKMVNGWAQVKYGGKTGYMGETYLAKLLKGGMTPSTKAGGGLDGKGGRMAMLHPNEIVSNPVDSKLLMEATKNLKAIDMNSLSQINPTQLPKAISKDYSNSVTNQMGSLVHIENFTGTQAEVDSVTSKLVKGMQKKGWR